MSLAKMATFWHSGPTRHRERGSQQLPRSTPVSVVELRGHASGSHHDVLTLTSLSLRVCWPVSSSSRVSPGGGFRSVWLSGQCRIHRRYASCPSASRVTARLRDGLGRQGKVAHDDWVRYPNASFDDLEGLHRRHRVQLPQAERDG